MKTMLSKYAVIFFLMTILVLPAMSVSKAGDFSANPQTGVEARANDEFKIFSGGLLVHLTDVFLTESFIKNLKEIRESNEFSICESESVLVDEAKRSAACFKAVARLSSAVVKLVEEDNFWENSQKDTITGFDRFVQEEVLDPKYQKVLRDAQDYVEGNFHSSLGRLARMAARRVAKNESGCMYKSVECLIDAHLRYFETELSQWIKAERNHLSARIEEASDFLKTYPHVDNSKLKMRFVRTCGTVGSIDERKASCKVRYSSGESRVILLLDNASGVQKKFVWNLVTKTRSGTAVYEQEAEKPMLWLASSKKHDFSGALDFCRTQRATIFQQGVNFSLPRKVDMNPAVEAGISKVFPKIEQTWGVLSTLLTDPIQMDLEKGNIVSSVESGLPSGVLCVARR